MGLLSKPKTSLLDFLMLYDRSYMRQPSEPVAQNTTIVTKLLMVTIGVFVLQNLLNVLFPVYGGRNYFLTEWFALSGLQFQELKVWTVLSYGFLHSSATSSFLFIPIPFAHLIFNMLCLYLIGRHVERIIGKTHFLYFYLGSILIGGLLYLLFHFGDAQPVIGASAGVAGIVSFFCLSQPNKKLLIIPIPVPIKSLWVFWGMLTISLFGLYSELSNTTNIAHSSHLGGIFAAVLFYRFVYNGSGSFFNTSRSRPSVELPEWVKRKKKVEPTITYKVNRSSRDELQREVDRILDKINTSGFGSLNADEKNTLDQAKDILSK
ncbi:MAG TPA: hypothetical protein DCX06_03135 [Opitutae bacterium]|nr:hypothetical protein [Opitutae bacterium]